MSYNDKKNIAYNTEKRRKIKEIKNNDLNKECFDCGAGYPEYISINNGIFICKECLNIHNNFPKQISNTLKNNLSSLNSKELEFMYLGGNQKLLQFINYEYPQLQRYKINILYQTKAMQYYRNNLYYLVYGGIKPIKPNEKVNAYELININEEGSKIENINTYQKLDNYTYREAKRNKSETTLDTVNKKNNKVKNKTYKSKKKKRKSSLLDTDDEDSLKRYKSFYKEMNKIFGTNIDIIYEDQRNSNIERKDNKEPKIISDNYKRRKDLNNGNESNMSKSNQYKNNINDNSKNTSNKEQPIEHIYNNNFFTLSATKNIFMFTPNKDSIIYKHRKINNDKNKNPINENIPSSNKVKEIYSKPKIPYLLTLNKKRENNHNLFFSLQENDFKHHNLNLNDENVNNININGDKYIKNINDISKESKHNANNRKTENKEMNRDTNTSTSKKCIVDNQDINYIHKNNYIMNNYSDNGENDNNAIFSKKRISKLMKRDRQTLENGNKFIFKDNQSKNDKKGNNLIFYRNEKKEDLNKNAQIAKNESKENKIDKIIKSIKNDIDIGDNKNKTFTEIRESDNKRRKFINSKNNSCINLPENDKKNPIMIEEGEEEVVSPDQKQRDRKEKNGMSRGEENKNITKIEEDKKLEYDSKKIDERKSLEIKEEHEKDNKDKNGEKYVDRRRKRYDKCIGIKKEVEKDMVKEKKINNENNCEINKKEEEIKKIEKEKENCIIKKFEKIKTNQDNSLSPLSKQNNGPSKTYFGRRDIRREHKNDKIDNSKDFHIHNSENPSCVSDKNFTEVSKNTNDNNENSGTKKFSIRNKYKMKKLKELV